MSNLRILVRDGDVGDAVVLTDKKQSPLLYSVVVLIDPHSAVARITYYTDVDGTGETTVETVDVIDFDVSVFSELVANEKIPLE